MPFQTDALFIFLSKTTYLIKELYYMEAETVKDLLLLKGPFYYHVATLATKRYPIFSYSLNTATADSTVQLFPSSFHPVFQDKPNSHKSKVKNHCYSIRRVR